MCGSTSKGSTPALLPVPYKSKLLAASGNKDNFNVSTRDLLDIGMSVGLLALLHGMAQSNIGAAAELGEKLILQGTGIGYVLDVGSGALIVIYCVWKVLELLCSREARAKTPAWAKLSHAGTLTFAIIANAFHASLDGDGVQPSPSFVCALTTTLNAVGSFVIYCFFRGIQGMTGPSAKGVFQTATINLFCLAAFPFTLAILGGESVYPVITKFLLNGHIFVYVAITTDPILKLAHSVTGLPHFLVARIFFPFQICGFVLEGAMVQYLQIDAHVLVHINVFAFVLTINAALLKHGQTTGLKDL